MTITNGVYFDDNVFAYTGDMFSFLSNGEKTTDFPGGQTYTPGTETFSLNSGETAGKMHFLAPETDTILAGTKSEMSADGIIESKAGTTVTFNASKPLTFTETWDFTVEGDDTIWWVGRVYEDTAGEPIYVSNYNFKEGEKYDFVGRDTSPSEVTDASDYQSVYGSTLTQGETGLRISDAASPGAPNQQDDINTPEFDGFVSYKAWLASDVTENADGTLTLSADAQGGSFTSYDNDNYFSDGIAFYSSYPNDLNQVGDAVFGEENVWGETSIFQAERIYLVQNPDDADNPFQFIEVSSYEGQHVFVTTAEVEKGASYNILVTDGSPGLDNGALTDAQEQSAEYKRLVMCFTRGARIRTLNGDVCVEDLSAGDQVLTRDNGYQAIRWIGSTKVSAKDLETNPELRPVRIRAGLFGEHSPSEDLILSPQHRVLVSSKIAERIYGDHEVLVPAKSMLGMKGVDLDERASEVEYFHILFDQHEIVFSNGMLTESLFTGPQALQSLSQEARTEILTLFPELETMDYAPTPCRTLANGGKAARLAIRHSANKIPLVANDLSER